MSESAETPDVNILIIVPCEHDLFKFRYVESIKDWLIHATQYRDKRPTLKFRDVHIISSGIPPLSEIKKYNGLIITGSFSSIGQNFPWMQELRHTIRLCFIHQIPIFGICFGFQILSQALGSTFAIAPYGYNFGVKKLKLERKAVPFFKRYLDEYWRLQKSNHVTEKFNGNGYTNHSNHDNEDAHDSVVSLFSHNDVVTSLPNPDNIDFGETSEAHRSEMNKSLSDMVAIKVSSNDKVPVLGMLAGNTSRVFFVSIQNHPEFDSPAGKKFYTDILKSKLLDRKVTPEELELNTKLLDTSNSGYVYGQMALDLFVDGYIKAEL